MEVLKEVGNDKVRAFIFSNKMLEFIVDSHKYLFDLLEFENSYEVFEQIVNKQKAEKLCVKLGIKRPKEYQCLDNSVLDIKYPVVIRLAIEIVLDNNGKFTIYKHWVKLSEGCISLVPEPDFNEFNERGTHINDDDYIIEKFKAFVMTQKK